MTPHATLRFYAELRDFLPADLQSGEMTRRLRRDPDHGSSSPTVGDTGRGSARFTGHRHRSQAHPGPHPVGESRNDRRRPGRRLVRTAPSISSREGTKCGDGG
jgi:hypothetical protein